MLLRYTSIYRQIFRVGEGTVVRILLLSNLYPPHVQGGAEILAADVAARLEGLGHEVLVLTSSEGLPKAQQDGRIWRILSSAPPAHFDRRRRDSACFRIAHPA